MGGWECLGCITIGVMGGMCEFAILGVNCGRGKRLLSLPRSPQKSKIQQSPPPPPHSPSQNAPCATFWGSHPPPTRKSKSKMGFLLGLGAYWVLLWGWCRFVDFWAGPVAFFAGYSRLPVKVGGTEQIGRPSGRVRERSRPVREVRLIRQTFFAGGAGWPAGSYGGMRETTSMGASGCTR